ncbi:MAG: hypothetical protein MI739_05620 [Bacteroidales bacterium]|nr:hypothetical protein [Bacteroidales bacterium]
MNIHIKRNIATFVFFILFGGIIFNSTFFLHAHRTACGRIVIHAHPYDKDGEHQNPLSKHKHNKIDLDQLSSIDYYTLKEISTDFKNISILESIFLCQPSNNTYYYIPEYISLRGPPVLS